MNIKAQDSDIIEKSKHVKTLSSLLRLLGLRTSGSNYNSMRRRLQNLNVNTSHWTGQSWSKGERLKNWNDYKKCKILKPHLIKERGHKCEMCKLEKWLDKPIGLELHHIDGDKTNNNIDNLKLLCLNCHFTTDNFRGRKPKCFCKCGKEINKKSKQCLNCYFSSIKNELYLDKRMVNRPSKEELIELIKQKPISQITKQFGLKSQTSIYNWCKFYKINPKEISPFSLKKFNLPRE